MFEFIHKPGEEDKYKRVAKNLGVDIGFRYEHGKFYARVNHCSIKDFTRELQRVIREEWASKLTAYLNDKEKCRYSLHYHTACSRKITEEEKMYDRSFTGNEYFRKAGSSKLLMTPEDVKRRLDAGEDPLMVSIDHWMENVRWMREEGELPFESSSADTCALCKAYQDPCAPVHRCEKCVLYEMEKTCDKDDSPWQQFRNDPSLSNAIAMLDALLSCLEYTPEPEKQFYIWQEGKEPEGKVGLRLAEYRDGIRLVTVDKNGHDEWFLCAIKHGNLFLFSSVDENLGFNVDMNEGYINIEKE